MIKFIFIILFFSSICFSDIFSTSMGECSLEIYGGKINNIPDIVRLIKQETKYLIDNYGSVNKLPFFIYITNNLDDFYIKSGGPVPEWGIAIAKLNPDRIIIKSPGLANISYARLKEVVIHELNHVYLYRLPHYFTIPSWFKEGLAMHRSNEFSLMHKLEISKSLFVNMLFPLKQLQNFNSIPKDRIKLAYGESAAAVEALEYYYGENTTLYILNNLHLGMDFQDALESAIKNEMLDFNIKFEMYLENHFNWIFLLSASNFIFVILPVILTIAFIYNYYRNKKIIKKWEFEESLENLD